MILNREFKNQQEMSSIPQSVLNQSEIADWNAEVRNLVGQLLQELVQNAFEHGGAGSVQLEIYDDFMNVKFDGQRFDPCHLLSAAMEGQGGKATIREFERRLGHLSQPSYHYDLAEKKNVFRLQFYFPIRELVPRPKCHIGPPEFDFKKEDYDGCQEVVLDISPNTHLSGLDHIIAKAFELFGPQQLVVRGDREDYRIEKLLRKYPQLKLRKI